MAFSRLVAFPDEMEARRDVRFGLERYMHVNEGRKPNDPNLVPFEDLVLTWGRKKTPTKEKTIGRDALAAMLTTVAKASQGSKDK